MFVASSNNAAVENVSFELPLLNKIAEQYQNECSFLKPIANKLFVQQNKPVWGLISAALGNSKNKYRFCDKVFYAPFDESPEIKANRIQKGEYLTIWEWADHYKGVSFSEARKNFITSHHAITTYIEEFHLFEETKKNYLAVTAQIQKHRDELKRTALTKKEITQLIIQLQQQLEQIKITKKEKHADLLQHHMLRPNFFARLFRTKKAKEHAQFDQQLRKAWRLFVAEENQLLQQLQQQEKEVKKLNHQIMQIEKALLPFLKHMNELQQKYYQLNEKFADLIYPPEDDNIEQDSVQIQSFWQSETLNQLRCEVFIAALKLHEAWLAEVLSKQKSLFRGNVYAISLLLRNQRPIDPQDELHLWQSLFMWVPVISSTFASIARLFKKMNCASLGWLLIDEAGQAVPQAAVGAIWRAKRTIVVGDPLQIEPVFTIAPNLIEGLAEFSLKNDFHDWLPTQTSVQILADEANPIGAYVESAYQQQWIGCPLRVHRRCLNPMFSVANKIAYNNKMIHARVDHTQPNQFPLGDSQWFHIVGTATDKQFVQAQGEMVLRLFAYYVDAFNTLPNIFIITPFKRVKYKLQQLISNQSFWQIYSRSYKQTFPPHQLKRWCYKHIGTIHTFQGKEISVVFFVLGVDRKNIGAANWASSKPNLLNVALTRARDRIYIIGDYHLWNSKPYFSALGEKLESTVIET